MSDIVKYEQHDAVAVVTLYRPDAMNSFDTDLRAALAFALEKAHEDDFVRAVILTGEGRTFSAGAAHVARHPHRVIRIVKEHPRSNDHVARA